jgi:hypothetical protein
MVVKAEAHLYFEGESLTFIWRRRRRLIFSPSWKPAFYPEAKAEANLFFVNMEAKLLPGCEGGSQSFLEDGSQPITCSEGGLLSRSEGGSQYFS